MERKMKLKSHYLLYLIFGFGILWHSIPATKNLVLGLTPWALILSYIIILNPEFRQKNFLMIVWLLIVSVITFFLEVIAVKTSLIFGEYIYGSVLGLKISGVPLVIGINWGIIIWGCAEIAHLLKIHLIIRAAAAGILAVFLDFLIEPAASSLTYWNWKSDIIPMQNYFAWFIIAFIFSLSYYILKIRSKSKMPVHFYISQVVFFGALNLLKV